MGRCLRCLIRIRWRGRNGRGMKIGLHILGILGSVFCIYIQALYLLFAFLTQSELAPMSKSGLFCCGGVLLSIIICLFFLVWNVRGLIGHIKKRE